MLLGSHDRVSKVIVTLLKLKVKDAHKGHFPIDESTMTYLCHKAKDVFLSEKNVLDVHSPVCVVGDVHGQYFDLLRIFARGGFPPDTKYLFLGDYVDRGKQSLESMCLLLAFKCKYPEDFFMLRGNHETATMTRVYGFYDECKRRCSIKMWKTFSDLFKSIPLAAVVDKKIFCCHGGLSPEMKSVDDIRRLKRPTDIPNSGILTDLMWADPASEVEEWGFNVDRGVSYVFGAKIVHKFLRKHDYDLMVRAHQIVEDGYEFFADQHLVTIFSAPNYCGIFQNKGAMMKIDENLTCSFQTFKIVDPTATP